MFFTTRLPRCLQLPRPHLHGEPGRVRDEVPVVPQLRAPGPGHSQLSGWGGEGGGRRGPRRGAPHKDSGLRHEQEPVRRRLLQDPGQSRAAHTMDGLGVYPHGTSLVSLLVP